MNPWPLPTLGTLVLAAFALAGCATAMNHGAEALRHGRYADAATHFEDALAKDPDRTGALLGLGIAKYKAGAWDEAIEPLQGVVAREPQSPTARL